MGLPGERGIKFHEAADQRPGNQGLSPLEGGAASVITAEYP